MFLKGYLSNPAVIGALFPSSKKLAAKISKHSYIAREKGLRYLEIGAGSGAVTQKIQMNMKLKDSLDIVEVDPKFCSILKRKYASSENIRIHEVSILDFEESKYDIVISSLPLNSFSSAFVGQVLEKLESLTVKGGFLSYFEYMGLKNLKQTYLFGEQLSDFKKTLLLKQKFANKYCQTTDKIWWNFPPARVIHCKIYS
jgi:phosphatidylethanolamine/phosphatidyl-N-methylethanolamine N-methyltransferase